MTKAIFISVEGIDRCGKSTLVGEIEKELKKRNIYVKTIRYPNRKNKTGILIDKILKEKEKLNSQAMQLLFSANRWEDSEKINSFLRNSKEEENSVNSCNSSSTCKVLLCDRYILSGVAYAVAGGVPEETILSCDRDLAQPTLTLFIDLTPDSTKTRSGFGEELFEEIKFQQKVYSAMKKNLSNYNHKLLPNRPAAELASIAVQHILSLLAQPTLAPAASQL